MSEPSAHRVPLVASLIAIGAGVVWSFGTLSARYATGMDAWQYLTWRSIGIIAVVEVLAAARGQRSPTTRAFTSGWRMYAASAALGLASFGYIYAVKNTTAANAAFLASMTPLVAVVMARVVLNEQMTTVTIGAIGVALAGLAITLSADVEVGSGDGNVAAMLSSVGFAAYTVTVRSGRNTDWSPVLPGYGVAMIALCSVVTLATGGSVIPQFHDAKFALLHGGVLIVVGTMMFNAASRTVPAVAMTVFAQSETVFAPFWVYVALSEMPVARTLMGGVLILAAVIGKAVLDSRPFRARTPASVSV